MTIDNDVKENVLLSEYPEVLQLLLKDQTATHAINSKRGKMVYAGYQKNIFWATDSYEHMGEGYQFGDEITISRITGENGNIIRPRSEKTKEEQVQRSKDHAEVFTPSWICNKQNNLVDNAWFGRENVFNTEVDEGNTHSWIPTEGKISFPVEKTHLSDTDIPHTGGLGGSLTWENYIDDNRLEVSCGEAPYLASRYDTITGEAIPLNMRIGLLDRKFRILNENVDDKDEWRFNAEKIFKSIYGYDWQGDNVLLARESLLISYIEYYHDRWNTMPAKTDVKCIAEIISWNIWQMDGLKMVIPNTCHDIITQQTDLFSPVEEKKTPCPGCKNNDIHRHNGIKCLIRDWNELPERQLITFESLVK